ncbi:hypothetical protein AB4Y85_10570 [Microvirga sp. 2YAF29]|uniref:hypothetical protein n=1 Tax=Microvirga sp. 2YAF29 TaxID=3233031 RepID=UPI003F9B57DA
MEKNDSLQAPAASAENAAESPASAIQIDPAANAALEEAIRSARAGLKPVPLVAPVTAAEPSTLHLIPKSRPTLMYHFAHAATAVVLIGAGWFASYMGTLGNQEAIERLAMETARSQEVLARLTSDLESLKGTMASYKDVSHTASTASATDQAKLTEKVERLTIALQEPGKKLSAIEARFDKFEGQITTTLNSLSAKPAVTAAAAAAAPESTRKTEPVDGWVLREVYNGSALVESRNRRLYEVMPGGVIPGVGRVESIERRGARWVVLTDKGFIGTYR